MGTVTENLTESGRKRGPDEAFPEYHENGTKVTSIDAGHVEHVGGEGRAQGGNRFSLQILGGRNGDWITWESLLLFCFYSCAPLWKIQIY